MLLVTLELIESLYVTELSQWPNTMKCCEVILSFQRMQWETMHTTSQLLHLYNYINGFKISYTWWSLSVGNKEVNYKQRIMVAYKVILEALWGYAWRYQLNSLVSMKMFVNLAFHCYRTLCMQRYNQFRMFAKPLRD